MALVAKKRISKRSLKMKFAIFASVVGLLALTFTGLNAQDMPALAKPAKATARSSVPG